MISYPFHTIKELNTLSPSKGRLLIAEPFMSDPYFKRSVVLVTEHTKKNTIGFIVNKPLAVGLNDILPSDFPAFDAPVYMGGPVQTDNLFYIHNQGGLIEGSIHIFDNLYWSGNFDHLKQLITDKQLFPNEIIFFVGYSCWEGEQLKEEINEESWIISNSYSDSLNNVVGKNLWKGSLEKMGKKYAVLANFPESPSLN